MKPIGQKNGDRSLKLNKIAVKQVISDNVASHHFEIRNKIKDADKRMFNEEFNEERFPSIRNQGNEISIS